MELGTRLEIGTALFEVAHVRTPCNDFKGWMGETGYDTTAWVKRFARALRPGPYLRVLRPGTIAAGDEIVVVHRPGHGVTVRDLFVALNLDRSRLPEPACGGEPARQGACEGRRFRPVVQASLPSAGPVI
nr:MOSC domain-containing protein [Nocardioides convexus]